MRRNDETKATNNEQTPVETLNNDELDSPELTSRRKFIGRVSGITAAAIAAGSLGLEPLLGSPTSEAVAAPKDDDNQLSKNDLQKRRNESAQVRHQAEVFNKQLGVV